MPDTLANLVRHMRWANDRVLAALRQSDPPNAEALRLYAHLLGAEEVWLSRIAGVKSELAVWPALTADECEQWASRSASRYDAIVREPDLASRERLVAYRNSAGTEYRNSVADIVTHVATHGCYHRGQIARQLRQDGLEPAYTDYIASVR